MNPVLEERWLTLCKNAGLDGPAGWPMLSSGYSEPGRAYHNLNHIEDCLIQPDVLSCHAIDPVAVEFAIWFHDLVYDTHVEDSEALSAEAAVEFLSDARFSADVVRLILATRHDALAQEGDAALMCDIDLSILGRDPGVYDAYASAIREEYSWVPLPDYVRGRIRVLDTFLLRPAIFAIEDVRERYGLQARENLTREIGLLGKGGSS